MLNNYKYKIKTFYYWIVRKIQLLYLKTVNKDLHTQTVYLSDWIDRTSYTVPLFISENKLEDWWERLSPSVRGHVLREYFRSADRKAYIESLKTLRDSIEDS